MAARPIACGKTVASRCRKPPVDSCTKMGMPRRVRSRATFDGVHKLRALWGRNPVEAPMRVICPMPWGIWRRRTPGRSSRRL